MVVKHSVVIRVTSVDDLQLMSTRRAMHRLLRICKACDVGGVDIWFSIPCIAGTPFRRIDEKLGAETGDFVISYKSVVATVGLSCHAVGVGDITVLSGAGMYALSNVLQEKLLKCGCTVWEALGILGAFETLVSVMQACSLEWTRFVYIDAWRHITTDPIENNLLAVCDETSLVSLKTTSLRTGSGQGEVDAVWSVRPRCGEASLLVLVSRG